MTNLFTLIDLVGYVTYTSPSKISGKSNSYSDMHFKTSPVESKRERVMPGNNLKRSLYITTF